MNNEKIPRRENQFVAEVHVSARRKKQTKMLLNKLPNVVPVALIYLLMQMSVGPAVHGLVERLSAFIGFVIAVARPCARFIQT